MKGFRKRIIGKAVEKAKEHKEDFSKFVAVGIMATILTMILLWLFTDQLGLYYIYSAIIGTQIGIIWNFVWHDRWTWGKRLKEKPLMDRFLNFEGIYIISQVANIILLYIFTEVFSVPYLISMLIAIGITFLYNYFMNRNITFRAAK